jgi:hypothetical protein
MSAYPAFPTQPYPAVPYLTAVPPAQGQYINNTVVPTVSGYCNYTPLTITNFPTENPVAIGSVLANATNFNPPGYLPCTGTAVLRTEFYDLFKVIGTYYGNGDGSTTFHLPTITNNYDQNIKYIIKYANN